MKKGTQLIFRPQTVPALPVTPGEMLTGNELRPLFHQWTPTICRAATGSVTIQPSGLVRLM